MAKTSKRTSKRHLLNTEIARRSGDKFQIGLVGVGGTGSHVLANLAAINSVQDKVHGRMLHVEAFDFDDIERHNVGKQNYYTTDIGENKAVNAVGRINRAYGTDWVGHPRKFQNEFTDILITCVDSWKAREQIWDRIPKKKGNQYRQVKPYYWLDIGNGQNSGQIILWSQHDNRMPGVVKYSKGGIVTINEERNSCSMVESLQTQGMFINKTMATLAMEMLYKLLYNEFLDHKGIVVNLDKNRVLPIML